MDCEHEQDDGAYVLGALTPAERAAYERHLATCSFCREAVDDMAVLPGLLGRLDPDEFAKMFDPTLTSSTRPPDPRSAGVPQHRPRRKRTGVRVVSSAAAAVLVAAIVGIGLAVTAQPETPAAAAVAMVPVDAAAELTADLGLTTTPGGTKVDLHCRYRGVATPFTVRLVAIGHDDTQETLGSWNAPPGKDFDMAAVTHLGSGDLSRLELVRGDGSTLLSYDVP